jgi:hypothetical protein
MATRRGFSWLAWRMSMASLVVMLASPAERALAQSPPTISKTWVTSDSPSDVHLSVEYNDGNAPSHYWFDFGTHPDLSGAARVAEGRETQAYGGIQQHPALRGLTPNTSYYYRAHVQTPFGSTVGPIESFRTSAPVAATAPGINFQNRQVYTWAGKIGWLLDYEVDSPNTQSRMYGLWSTDPDMKGAKVVPDPQFGGGVRTVGPGPWAAHLFIPFGTLPENVTLYIQGVAENSGGQTKSAVTSFLNVPANPNY